MTAIKRIWALLDERQGNTSQTLGVAEALGLPFETKQVLFNPLVRMPNRLICHSLIGMAAASRPLLTPPWPDVTIGCARRLGLVASYIKAQNPACFTAQIQWPGFPSKHFSLIAAPLHDGARSGGNVFTTLAAPHRVTREVLAREAEKWRGTLAALRGPRVALLVGGSARMWKFTAEHAKELAALASQLTNALGGSLLITTSRRTDAQVQVALESSLACPHYFHHWDDAAAPAANPYFGFLGLADAIIATGDSISMCSEACATGKPSYVYARDGFMTPKHRMFVGELCERGFVRRLEGETIAQGLFAPAAWVDATAAIAQEIRKRAGLPAA